MQETDQLEFLFEFLPEIFRVEARAGVFQYHDVALEETFRDYLPGLLYDETMKTLGNLEASPESRLFEARYVLTSDLTPEGRGNPLSFRNIAKYLGKSIDQIDCMRLAARRVFEETYHAQTGHTLAESEAKLPAPPQRGAGRRAA
jgi:hypothetical protein